MKKRPVCKLPKEIVNILDTGTKITGTLNGITFRVKEGKQQFYKAVNKVYSKKEKKNG